MIYVNGDGLWLRCTCMQGESELIASRSNMVLTFMMVREILKKHGHH